jgi:hypothetical protein
MGKGFLGQWEGGHGFLLTFLCLWIAAGCTPKPHYSVNSLPLPPTENSGLVNGEYLQTQYGFAFPVPAKWQPMGISEDQEVDEIVRFTDPLKTLVARFSVQLLPTDNEFSPKEWSLSVEKDLQARQFQINSKDSRQEWKTGGSEKWVSQAFSVLDVRQKAWLDTEWVLNRGDMLLLVHATLPEEKVATEEGKKLLMALEGSVTRIHWYMPIGTRGISPERYELQAFTEGFLQALESGSVGKTYLFFDDLYPGRGEWASWYQQALMGKDPKTLNLKASLGGLVINGENATASFILTLKNPTTGKDQKLERSFKLSKKERTWKITEPSGKK